MSRFESSRGCVFAVVTCLVAGLFWLPRAASGEESGGDWFEDHAQAAGLVFTHFNGASGRLYFVEMMGGGVALLDYDRDGDLDVYLVQGTALGSGAGRTAASQSDQLFRNDTWRDAHGERHLMFVDVSAAAGLPAGDYGMGVASGDIDNDGWPDLYVTNFGRNRLLHNLGDGSFVDVTAVSGTDDPRWSLAASFFDFDSDGLLDLYVGNYVEYRLATHRPCYSDTGVLDYCGPGGFLGESDRLFRNRGGGVFEDISRRSGVGQGTGAGLGSASGDFDGDARIDLYVANDGDSNSMWLNQGDSTFEDGALLSGTAVNAQGIPEASMGVVVGDFNGDGLEDLFMSHLSSETNTLYLNEGGGLFSDRSNESGLGLSSWAFTGFGIAVEDFDHDGQLDVYVANGAVKLIEEQVSAGDPLPLRQRNQLFVGVGNGRLVERPGVEGGVMAFSEVSRGVAAGDIDNDGDADLVVVNNGGVVRLLINSAGSPRPWSGLSALGAGMSEAIGTLAMIETEDRHRWRRIATDGSYASSRDPRVRWGLGASAPVTLEVRWPQGDVTRVLGVPPNRYLVLRQPAGP